MFADNSGNACHENSAHVCLLPRFISEFETVIEIMQVKLYGAGNGSSPFLQHFCVILHNFNTSQ